MLTALTVLALVALALAIRLSQDYQRERRSHELARQRMLAAVEQYVQQFEAGLALGQQMGQVNVPPLAQLASGEGEQW